MRESYDDTRARAEIERLIDIKVSQTLIEELTKARREGVFWAARRVCPGCAARLPRVHVAYVLHDSTVVDTEMHPGETPETAMTECRAARFINGPEGDQTWTG
jgi:hypothetical protein